MRSELAVDQLTTRRLWDHLKLTVDYMLDDYLSGRLSKEKARRYRDRHHAIVTEIRMRGEQLRL